jgi:hypothetical protein
MIDSQLIFIHLPKTGGTTVRSIIERQYPTHQLYKIYNGASSFSTMEDFASLTEEDNCAIKVYMGHVSFSLQERIPGNPRCFTLVRDPVYRVLSYYHHVMTLHERFKDNKISLIKFLNRGDKEIDNLQVRKISGVDVPVGRCTEEMLWTAIENIERCFCVVGTTDRFDESICLLADLMGWETPLYVKENVSKQRPSIDYFSQMEINQIKQRNQLDTMLYSYVSRRLNKQITDKGVDIERAVKTLKEEMACRTDELKPHIVWQ